MDTQIHVNYTFTPITRYRFPAIIAFISYPVTDKIWKQAATDYSYPLIDTLLNYSIIKAKSVSCCVCFLYQPWMNFFAVLVSFSLAYSSFGFRQFILQHRGSIFVHFVWKIVALRLENVGSGTLIVLCTMLHQKCIFYQNQSNQVNSSL